MSEEIYKRGRLLRALKTPKMKAASAAKRKAAMAADDASWNASRAQSARDTAFSSRMRADTASQQSRKAAVAQASRQPKVQTRVNADDQITVGLAGRPQRRATQSDLVGSVGKAESVYKAARRTRQTQGWG